MTGVTVAALWIRAFKWRLVLGRNAGAVGAFFLSKAAGEWSPGRLGELSPLLIRKHRYARMGAWIVVDRILEMAVTLGLGVAGIALLQVPNRGLILALAAITGAGLVLALLLLTQRAMFIALAGRFREGTRARRVTSAVADVSEAVLALRRYAGVAFAITLVAGCIDVWASILLFQSFGWSVSFSLIAAGKGVHAVTSAIPITPNATGVPYLATAVLIHEVGGVPSDVLAAAIALSVVVTNLVFWLSLGVGARGMLGGGAPVP